MALKTPVDALFVLHELAGIFRARALFISGANLAELDSANCAGNVAVNGNLLERTAAGRGTVR